MSTTRTAVIALAIAAAGLGLAGCGSPKTVIDNSGTYNVGTDVVAGTYVANEPRKYGDDPKTCTWSIGKGGTPLATQNGGQDGGGGISRVVHLTEGLVFTTINCGPWHRS